MRLVEGEEDGRGGNGNGRLPVEWTEHSAAAQRMNGTTTRVPLTPQRYLFMAPNRQQMGVGRDRRGREERRVQNAHASPVGMSGAAAMR